MIYKIDQFIKNNKAFQKYLFKNFEKINDPLKSGIGGCPICPFGKAVFKNAISYKTQPRLLL